MNKLLGHLIRFSMRQSSLVLMGSILLIAIGIKYALHLPIDAVPDVTNIQVVINSKTHALDPLRVERLVTLPIESEMAGLPHVEEVRSLSKFGLSQVVVVFEEGTSLDRARQWVSERVISAQGLLPEGVRPELAPMTTGLGEVVMYSLSRKGRERASPEDLMYLREVQNYRLRPALKRVPGVADVDTNGGWSRQYHVNIDPARLAKWGLSLDYLERRLDALGESFGGGVVEPGGQQLVVRTVSSVDELERLSHLPLNLTVSGQMLRLSDVAEIRIDGAMRLGAASRDGQETVLGTVLMRVGANSRDVASTVEEVLISGVKLPEDVELRLLYTRSHLVQATLKTVARNLLEGAVLVIGVLFLVLGNLRFGFLVALAIPLSMLFAALGMSSLGVSANLMSLGALDFGLLVDGSLVVVENMIRRWDQSTTDQRGDELLGQAAREVMGPALMGVLIIMVTYFPVLALQGVEGKMFRPMAETVLLALLGSLLVAIFVMPAAAAWILKRRPSQAHHGAPWFDRLTGFYSHSLRWVLLRPRAAGVFATAILVSSGFGLWRLGGEFLPPLDEGDIVINVAREATVGLTRALKDQMALEEKVRSLSDVGSVFSRLGTSDAGLDPMAPAMADMFVLLDPDLRQQPDYSRRKQKIIYYIETLLREMEPTAQLTVTQPISMRMNELLEGSRADVSMRILGPNLDDLVKYIGKARDLLGALPGLRSVEQDALTALTESGVLDVKLNFQSLTRLGVSTREVQEAVATAMGGKEVGSVYRDDRRFPIVVHLEEQLREDFKKIEQIPVPLPQGGTVPLRDVASLEQSQQVTTVARTMGQRYASLAVFLDGADVQTFVSQAKKLIAEKLPLPPDYRIVWGGQFKHLEKARATLVWVMPLVVLTVFFLLLQTTGRGIEAILILSLVPLALSGGVVSLLARGMELSVPATIGFIALGGIGTLNALVLVSFLVSAAKSGFSLEHVVEAAALRFRPVLTTALVAGLGFLPMALSTGVGAEIQRPLATVVVGGLVTSTLLTLYLLPTVWFITRRCWPIKT